MPVGLCSMHTSARLRSCAQDAIWALFYAYFCATSFVGPRCQLGFVLCILLRDFVRAPKMPFGLCSMHTSARLRSWAQDASWALFYAYFCATSFVRPRCHLGFVLCILLRDFVRGPKMPVGLYSMHTSARLRSCAQDASWALFYAYFCATSFVGPRCQLGFILCILLRDFVRAPKMPVGL